MTEREFAIRAETLRLHDLRYGRDHCDRKYVTTCGRYQEQIFQAAENVSKKEDL